jgi:hypothetical protein
MRITATIVVGVTAVLAVFGTGCKEKQVNAVVPLQESFQAADVEVKKAVTATASSLQAGNYVEAARALDPIVSRRVLTPSQKQAVGMTLQQINQAVAANPQLDTKEMYELRARMFRAVQSGPRF